MAKGKDILDRLKEIGDKMTDPKTSSKEMKLLKLREENLLEMFHDDMDEFSLGGDVRHNPNRGKTY
tara:strand:- start:766 stop:963 length:198 start_codon:yes stop_codon:yes gene_type:complete